MKTVSILFLLSFVGINFLSAQNPVKWIITSKKLDNNKIELEYTATIDKGWKLYAQNIGNDGPVPLEFTIENSYNIKEFATPTPASPPTNVYSKIFDMPLRYFKGEATFKQAIRIEQNVDSAQIAGYLTYMTCDSKRCLPPKDLDYSFCFANRPAKTFNGKPIKSIRVGHCSSLPSQN